MCVPTHAAPKRPSWSQAQKNFGHFGRVLVHSTHYSLPRILYGDVTSAVSASARAGNSESSTIHTMMGYTAFIDPTKPDATP